MGEVTKRTQQPSQSSRDSLPAWAEPIVRASNAIFPFLLIIASLLFVLTLALICVKLTKFSWIPNVLGAFSFFAVIAVLATLIAKFRSMVACWVSLALGVGLFFFPFLLEMLANQLGIPTTDAVLRLFAVKVKDIGVYTIFLSVIGLMIAFIRLLMSAEQSRQEQRFRYIDVSNTKSEKPSLIPKCWQMSRCRPAVRVTCPNYLERTPCWKRRSGCFCDKSLADYLISSSKRGEAQEVIDLMQDVQMQQSTNSIRGHLNNKKNRRPWKIQKRFCHDCPLFVEHQEYKYKRFSALCFPITLAIVAVSYRHFDYWYKWGLDKVDTFIKSSSQLSKFADLSTLVNSSFEYLLLAVLTLLLFSYVISLIDKCFLEWKM